MKLLIHCLLCMVPIALCAQVNTDVFLFDIETRRNAVSVSNYKNISNNDGYDNQPSFLNDDTIIYASTRNGQTDIAQYFIKYESSVWLNFTEGSEYSPLKIPNKYAVSAVRLDKDGKQALYTYNLNNGESAPLIQDIVVAYYTWYNENMVVSAVIEGDELNLFVTNISDGTSRKYATNVGRSFHNIPGSELVSFISKQNDEQWQIKSLDPKTGAIKLIANTLGGIEDICWLDRKTILSGKKNILYKLTLNKDNDWKVVNDLSSYGITNITRLATNSLSTKLLVAGDIDASYTVAPSLEETNEGPKVNETEPSAAENTAEILKLTAIVQRQLDAYNARNIDAFLATYTDDVELYSFPNQLLSKGKEQMRKDYMSWFERNPDLKAIIKKRIVIDNKVIDEEQVSANGRVLNAVAIYEIENGLISRVTFIQ